MNANTERRISQFLAKHNTTIDSTPQKQIKELESIDEAIQSSLKKINEAQKTIRDNRINTTKIATKSGLSRAIFYKNKLFGEYVQEYQTPSTETTISKEELTKLKEDLAEANRKINKMVHRDSDTEDLRQENIKLQGEIENLQTLNQNLEEQCEKLQKENEELRDKIPPSQNVIPFDKKKQ